MAYPNRPRRITGAVILIGIGIFFLLINTGGISFNDIGAFFGRFGGSIGTFFGQFGAGMGRFFGSFGASLGRFFAAAWPLIMIVIGAVLLLRRPAQAKSKNSDIHYRTTDTGRLTSSTEPDSPYGEDGEIISLYKAQE